MEKYKSDTFAHQSECEKYIQFNNNGETYVLTSRSQKNSKKTTCHN